MSGFALLILLVAVSSARAENGWKERSFNQPVSSIQAALKKLDQAMSGPLPLVAGFVASPMPELDRYQRPYYQLVVHVQRASGGGSLVRVAAKITAWDPEGHGAYRVLPSNGRLESDLFARIEGALALSGQAPGASTAPAAAAKAANAPPPDLAAPVPQIPRHGAPPVSLPITENPALEREANNLEEILRNQSHPENLLAVKQDLTPILQSPSSDAKVLFLASAEDEFEILDLNSEWVHVRISGLARGWLRRSMVEMLDSSKDPEGEPRTHSRDEKPPMDQATNMVFSISSEQLGSFPGDWAPLKGKSVRIISVRETSPAARITSPEEKMRFAVWELKKQNSSGEAVAGVVLIFDAEDGGIVAVPRAPLEQWKAGVLSDQRFWRECYLNPPEILGTQ